MAKNWMKGAVKRPGAFSAKAKAVGVSTAAYAKEKQHAPGLLGKQARLALVFEGEANKTDKAKGSKKVSRMAAKGYTAESLAATGKDSYAKPGTSAMSGKNMYGAS